MNETTKNRKWDWSALSRCRSELFGISAISIIILHFTQDIMTYSPSGNETALLASRIYRTLIGSVGVEIFLFLSGMGLYFSMSKNPAPSITVFYKKRLRRVLIPYAIYGLIYWGLKDLIFLHKSPLTFLLDFTTLSFYLSGDACVWFVSFILVMYLIFPLLYRFEKEDNRHRDIYTLVFVAVGFGATFGSRFIFPALYNNIEIAAARIPIFVLGTYYGKKIIHREEASRFDILLCLSGVALKITDILAEFAGISVFSLIPGRFTSCFYSFAVMFLLSYLFSSLKLTKLKSALAETGKYSFELYITHVTIRQTLWIFGVETYKIVSYIAVVILSVIFSLLLNRVTDVILNLRNKKEAVKTGQ